MHDQVRVGKRRVDRLDALDGQHVAGRLVRELIGAVLKCRWRSPAHRTAVSSTKSRRLLGIGQELRA